MHDPDEISPDEQTREFRYFGPPGTGKTTTLTRQIARAARKYGPDKVLVTSFTRTAAAELVGRGLAIDRDRVGTLHAHCHRALGKPKIAEAYAQEWNEANPSLAISAKSTDALDGESDGGTEVTGSRSNPGSEIFELINRYRGALVPLEEWTIEARAVWKMWSKYKAERDLLDFTDLIEIATRELRYAPAMPSVIFADEAQDLNPLQLKLIRQWGRNTEYFIVAGDDDQLLYGWCGCKAEALLNPPLPADSIRVLSQSYRLPRSVHAHAVAWIKQVEGRQEKPYHPRDADGLIKMIPYHWRAARPELMIDRIAGPHLKKGETVMILTSCSYMLEEVRTALRAEGIPFHNPYRKTNGWWNPLRHSKGSASARTLALFAAHPAMGGSVWRREDLRLFTEWMPAQLLQRGAKTRLSKLSDQEKGVAVDERELIETFHPAALDQLITALDSEPGTLAEWWKKGMSNADYRKRADYPLDVAVKSGPDALIHSPQVIIGTIHSVKGGQADAVILFPDISVQGRDYARTQDGHDALQRLFYVGMTRARSALYLAAPASPDLAVDWTGLPVWSEGL